MNSLLIDCEFVSCKKQKLNVDEMQLEYAVEDEYGNRYFIFEMGYRAYRKNKLIAKGLFYFHTGFKLRDLRIKSELRKKAAYVKKYLGGFIGIFGLQQRKVKKCVRNLVEIFNAKTLYYKGGICERALYNSTFPFRDIINIENYAVEKNGNYVGTKCHLHNYDIDHCAQADLEFYSTQLEKHLGHIFYGFKKKAKSANLCDDSNEPSVRVDATDNDEEMFDVEEEKLVG